MTSAIRRCLLRPRARRLSATRGDPGSEPHLRCRPWSLLPVNPKPVLRLYLLAWRRSPRTTRFGREKRQVAERCSKIRRRERQIQVGRYCLDLRLLRAGLRRRRLVEQLDDAFVKPVAHLKALRGPGDIADNDVDSGGARAHFHGGVRGKLAQTGGPGATLPLRFGKARSLVGFFEHRCVDEFDHRVAFFRRWDGERDVIAHPLTRSRKVKILALDGEAVDETDTAPRRMALVRPVACLEHGCAENTDLRNFTRDAIDLYPIANPNAMLT